MKSSNDTGSGADRIAPQRAAKTYESVSASADGTSNAKRDSEHDSVRRQRIQTAAYYRAMARGFTPGFELDDWFAAEVQIDADASNRDENAQIEGVGGGMDEQPGASAPRSASITAPRSDGNSPASAKQKIGMGARR